MYKSEAYNASCCGPSRFLHLQVFFLQNLHERHEVGEEPNQQDEKYLYELALK